MGHPPLRPDDALRAVRRRRDLGEIGIRKPAPEIYRLGAERTGVAPEACVYVDDLVFNLPPAAGLGMATVHHTSAETTVPELERLLGMSLTAA